MPELKQYFYGIPTGLIAKILMAVCFQKALEEVLKQYPSTHQPATLYKAWLTQLMQNLLNQYDVKEPVPLSLLLVNILEGMTIQAQVEHGSIKINDYWTRVEKLIDFERAA